MKDHTFGSFALEIFVFIEYKTRTFSESIEYLWKFINFIKSMDIDGRERLKNS